jgi:radical SAM protein (TIGR01212 family)
VSETDSTAARYYSFGRYLRERFGEKVRKLSVDAGFSCPHLRGGRGCVYCDTSAFTPPVSGTITEQLEQGKARVGKHLGVKKFLAYFQPRTNTFAPAAKLEALYREALAVSGVVGLAIGTRPDCVPDEVLNLLETLAKECELWVEYGLQSANDETLKRINRAHDVAAFTDAVQRTKGRNIKICVHVIFGLPGETREDMMRTAQLVADLGLDGIKFHHLHVVKGTRLHEMYDRGEVGVFEFEEYANLVADAIKLLPPNMVVQRLFGWAPPDMLVAPDWKMTRGEIQTRMEKIFDRRGIRQGGKGLGK